MGDDGRLRARDVGHDSRVRQGRAPRACQLVDQRETVRRGRPEDDEIGTQDGGVRRRGDDVQDPIRPRALRAIAGRRPAGHRPAVESSADADRACDRTRDQAEPEEGDVHTPEYAGRPGQPPVELPRFPAPNGPAILDPALTVAGIGGRRLPPASGLGRSRRPGIVGRVHSPDLAPSLALASLIEEWGAAPRTPTLLGGERRERADRVQRAATGPTRQIGHAGPRSSVGPRAPLRPSPVDIRSPRGCHRDSARRPPGRNARGRTG